MTASPIPARLAALRQQLEKHGVHAYLVPSSDPHLSEYVPDCWQRRAWLTGFTGSAGFAYVDLSKAFLWTDSRYFLQAEGQLAGSGIELVRMGAPGTPEFTDWLTAHLKPGQTVGIDSRTLSLEQERKYRAALEKSDAKLVALDANLVDAIWTDRPLRSTLPVTPFSESFAGESCSSKLGRIAEALRKENAQAHVVTLLDAVAWLFNLRGRDVDYNPIFIAHALVTTEGATLFIDLEKLDGAKLDGSKLDGAKQDGSTLSHLPPAVRVRPYDDFGAALDELGTCRVSLEPATCPGWVAARLVAAGARLHEERSPLSLLKARKNEAELAGARLCHLRDGVAMVRFLCWLEEVVPKGATTEISAATQLERFRSEGVHFQGLSFPSISAMGPHGAIVHYRPETATDAPLSTDSLYLIDSGAQYLDGTTDITRTVCLGSPTAEQKNVFTRVLRGHVALARQVFPAGTTGKHLDALARLPLWDVGLNYGHGTGHGVGAHLCVHEGPQGISPKSADVALEAGMILSNEPGCYRAGEWGVRIESLVIVTERAGLGKEGQTFLGFDTITACPIDRRLIDVSLLSEAERLWVDSYHAWVREALSPRVSPAERAWLAGACAPLPVS